MSIQSNYGVNTTFREIDLLPPQSFAVFQTFTLLALVWMSHSHTHSSPAKIEDTSANQDVYMSGSPFIFPLTCRILKQIHSTRLNPFFLHVVSALMLVSLRPHSFQIFFKMCEFRDPFLFLALKGKYHTDFHVLIVKLSI